jgi:bla regulator protein blaR1
MSTSATLGPALQQVADLLVRNSIHGAVLIALIWIVCRAAPRLPASVRCALWWIASARLVVGMVWLTPVDLPLLPVSDEPPPWHVAARVAGGATGFAGSRLAPADGIDASDPRRHDSSETSRLTETPAQAPPFEWEDGVAMAKVAASLLWIFALVVFVARAAREMRRQRRLLSRASTLDPNTLPTLGALRARLGLKRLPTIVASQEVSSPQVVWVGQPVVVLPTGAPQDGGSGRIEMALCHELIHLRRGDLWWGALVAAAERLFFFHPLVRFAAREYHINREAACDAEVVRALGAAPRDYGRLLVAIGIGSRRSALAIPVASSSLATLKRRLHMLQHVSPSSRTASRWWYVAVAAALVGTVPIQLVARRADETPLGVLGVSATLASDDLLQTPPPAPSPEPAPSPAPPRTPRRGQTGATPPVPPTAPQPPEPPVPPRHGDMSYGWDDAGESWAFVTGDGSMTMHLSHGDPDRIRRLRTGKEPIFWFERDGKAYVIRDPKVLDRIGAMLAPQRELGDKQGALGEKQGALGEKQGDIGARQGDLGARQGELGAKQAELGAEQARLASEQIRSERGHDEKMAEDFEAQHRELEAQMEKLSDEMEALGRQMEEMGRQQEALGDQQEALGREQEALGRQQEEMMRRIEDDLRRLMDESIQSGAAQVVK